jgi:hypothetical protein
MVGRRDSGSIALARMRERRKPKWTALSQRNEIEQQRSVVPHSQFPESPAGYGVRQLPSRL